MPSSRRTVALAPGPYHVRLGSTRATEFPTIVRRVLASLPGGSDALLDLCDVRSLDRFSARAVHQAIASASRHDVRVVVAANDATVRRALHREGVADVGDDMTDARRRLGVVADGGRPPIG